MPTKARALRNPSCRSRHVPLPGGYIERRVQASPSGMRLAGMTEPQSHAYRRIVRWQRQIVDSLGVLTSAENMARMDRIRAEMDRWFPGYWEAIEQRRQSGARVHSLQTGEVDCARLVTA